jgi:hypothetical protein
LPLIIIVIIIIIIIKQEPKELEGKEKGKTIIVRIRYLKKTLKNVTETWA